MEHVQSPQQEVKIKNQGPNVFLMQRPEAAIHVTERANTQILAPISCQEANRVCTGTPLSRASKEHIVHRASNSSMFLGKFQVYHKCQFEKAPMFHDLSQIGNPPAPRCMKTKRSTSGAIDGSFWRQNVEASRKMKQTSFDFSVVNCKGEVKMWIAFQLYQCWPQTVCCRSKP